MRKTKPTLWMALASATLLLSACGQSGDQQNTQNAASASTHSAPVTQQAEPAASETKPTESVTEKPADHVVETDAAPGAMGAKAEPEQPKAPADKGAEVYGQCVGCHGPRGGGGVGPRLAGQSADALMRKLKDYKAGKQMGPQTAMMAPIAQGLSDADIEAVANYIAKNFK